MGAKLTQAVAIARMQASAPMYSYHNFVYHGSQVKGLVACPIHGEFPAPYDGIMGGHGCPECKREATKARSFLPQHTAISRIAKKFPDYDYSRFVHATSGVLGVVVCPSHGEFQSCYKYIMSGRGCPKCGVESRTSMRTLEEEVALQRMKDRLPQYDYSKFVYRTSGSKSTVVCSIHGEFPSSYNFIVNGTGCKKCHFEALSVSSRTPFSTFVERARKVHGSTYTYREETYGGMSESVVAQCKAHGDFLVSCGEHIYGQGCPDCKDTGFNPKKRAFLYLYQIVKDGVPYMGYGITGSVSRRNAEHQRRLSAAGLSGSVLHVFRFRRGYVCRLAESFLLSLFERVDLGVDGFRREATHWHNYSEALVVATDLQYKFGTISDIDEAIRIAA